jgi:hypothetical protein
MNDEIVIDEVGKFRSVESDTIIIVDWMDQVANRFGVALSSDRVKITNIRFGLG